MIISDDNFVGKDIAITANSQLGDVDLYIDRSDSKLFNKDSEIIC